jgi:hypothetical protein
MLRGKSTVNQAGELLDILKEILLTAKFDDRERFKQIVLEEKSGMEAGLASSGHAFANQRLKARFSEAGWAQEQISGISYLFALRDLAKDIEKKWPAVVEKLEAMRAALVNRNALLCNVTVDAANWQTVQPQLDAFLATLPAKDLKLSTFNFKPSTEKEGLAIPAQVNFVGKAANLYDLGYKYDGSAEVILGYLRMAYLWEKVRVQGGAYGGFATFEDNSGYFAYLSYRDPNVASTLESYDKAGAFLKHLDSSRLSDNELNKAIIAAIGDLDAYQLPDAKGYTSMMRHLTGRTDEIRQRTREQVLSTNGEDFIAFGEVLEKVAQSDAVAVVGSQSALEGAGVGLKVVKVL